MDQTITKRNYTREDFAKNFSLELPPAESDLSRYLINEEIQKDPLMIMLLQKYPSLIYQLHHHASLFYQDPADAVSEEDQQAALAEFESDLLLQATSALSGDLLNPPSPRLPFRSPGSSAFLSSSASSSSGMMQTSGGQSSRVFELVDLSQDPTPLIPPRAMEDFES